MSDEAGAEAKTTTTTIKGEVKEEEKAETTEKKTTDIALTDDDNKAVEDVKGRLKFFFSDANVRQDNFIRKLLMGPDSDKDNDEGATKSASELPNKVPIETLLRFNTIKSHTTNPAVIVKAAKELSDVLKLVDNEEAIGRVVPFTESMMDDNIPKTLHISNLPVTKPGSSDDNGDNTKKENNKQYAVKMEEVRDLFTKYGDVELVKLRWSPFDRFDKTKKRFALGSALVEFYTEESMQKAVEATLTIKDGGEKVEPKEKLTLGDSTLEVMTLKEFIRKRKKHKAERLERIESKNNNKKRKIDDATKDDEEEGTIEKFTIDWKPGCVIKMKGLPDGCDRECILDMIASALEVSSDQVKDRKIYADFSRGQVEGAIRFPEPSDDIAGILKRLKEGELKVKDKKLDEAFLLEGDDEKKYWEDFIAFKNRQIQNNIEAKRNKKYRRGGGGGRGGRGRGRR